MDLKEFLDAGMAIVGVVIGAGLTYVFGALNRRHQEEREDKTRWYEARREAYGALLIAASRVSRSFRDEPKPGRPTGEPMDELIAAMGALRLVGSPPVIEAADNLFTAILEDVALHGQKLLEMARRKAEDSEMDLDLLEEELDNLPRARTIHMPAARKAFEEAARKDLGKGPSGRAMDT